MTAPDPDWLRLRAQADPDDPATWDAMHTVYRSLTRGGTTPGGLPYPAPTDPIAEGADAIRTLAESFPVVIRSGIAQQATDTNGILFFRHGGAVRPIAYGATLGPSLTEGIDLVGKITGSNSDSFAIAFRVARTDQNVWLAGNPVTVQWWAAFPNGPTAYDYSGLPPELTYDEQGRPLLTRPPIPPGTHIDDDLL